MTKVALDSTLSLLQRAQAGDRSALEQLARHYRPLLLRFAHGRLPRYARSLNETQDIVDTAMVRTFDRLPAIDLSRSGAVFAYMRQAVIHQVCDEIRRARRRPVTGELTDDLQAPGPNPLDEAINRENRELYERARDSLRPAQRTAIILKIEMGWSPRAIAHALGRRSEEAGRMFLRRAIRALVDAMRDRPRP